MKKYAFIALLLACISCQTKTKPTEVTVATDSLTTQFQEIYDRGNIHGFAISVVEADQVLYQHAFGHANVREGKAYSLSTKQSIASISKTLVGVALLKAQELGKLTLDDPVNDYLPIPIQNPHYPEVPITLRHLANHTSSLIDTDFYESTSYVLQDSSYLHAEVPIKMLEYFNAPVSPISIQEFMNQMLYTEEGACRTNLFTDQKPGATFQYSNGGTTLAAVIIELATGLSFEAFTEKYILNPLMMDASSWNANDITTQRYYEGDTIFPAYYNRDYPAGGLITNTKDLSKYLQELIKGYTGKGNLLSKESYHTLFNTKLAKESAQEQFPDSENVFMNIRYDQGIFMGMAPKGYLGHTGADPGTVTFLFFNLQTGRGFTFMTNRIIWTGFDEALADLWDILKILENETAHKD